MSSVSYKVTDTVNENINQSYSSNLFFLQHGLKDGNVSMMSPQQLLDGLLWYFVLIFIHGPQKSKRRFMIGASPWRTPPLA